MKLGGVDFDFTPPPEAPVFEPTKDEFVDPLAYIAKIRPIAERAGICKIKPPPDWQPPFAVDVDNFKFTPRIQRLNELEAKTRIKLNFLDKIAKFWELQGSSLKIPTVERKALDLHTLHVIVKGEGGFETVCHERKWSRVAAEMSYPSGKSVGSLLRGHYERILYPYDIFKSGNQTDVSLHDGTADCSKKDRDYIPHGIPSRQAIKPPVERFSRRSKRQVQQPEGSDNSCGIPETCGDSGDCTNSELRKLQFYGAGPKMPGYSATTQDVDDPEEVEVVYESNPQPQPEPLPEPRQLLILPDDEPKYIDPIDQIVCHVCGRGDAEESMLLCDGCDDSYHTFCLLPPLNEIPKGDWRCPRCIAKECHKPQECFGFEQAKREYTLQSFGEMADQFKCDYFNMPVHMVPTSTVEKEFWRLVGAIDEDVTVQYGADLHTMEHGSGFPTRQSAHLMMPGDEEYATCGWNLNVLPVLDGSVLCHINADISGMKIPWMYVGMCFATFCWHNEDHWSYSINYLHWGEPKTWYGVPGCQAHHFEESMRRAAPELFDAQPDLLHQLVTIMNPNILMKAGVPVYRTNQCAGEFVVTFPRAYHAGFNQGYNFAEAVNFCPSDWLQHGRSCIEHYSHHHRFCVFSHDELICKMAADPDSLDLHLAAATYQDMLKMVEQEMRLRKALMEQGIVSAEREAFELLPDDERQCDQCKTTCFLSAVTCACTTRLVCIKHNNFLCDCALAKRCLRFRYTLDELPAMLHRLKTRAESFDNWALAARKCLQALPGLKPDLSELKELIREAEEKRFPDSELLQSLTTALSDAERCASVAQQLVSKRVRTRKQQQLKTSVAAEESGGASAAKLSLDELEAFLARVDKLACEISEAAAVKELLRSVGDFRDESQRVLGAPSPAARDLERLVDAGLAFDVDLPEVVTLQQKLHQVKWLDEVDDTLAEPERVTLDVLRRLVDAGLALPPQERVEESVGRLQEVLDRVERCEDKARTAVAARPPLAVVALDAIVAEAANVPAYLPNVLALKDAIRKAREWTSRLENIQGAEHFPYLDALESALHRGRQVPVRLEQLPQLESQVSAARAWRERAARIFLKKNSPIFLLEVLSPRTDVGIYPSSKSRRKKSVTTTVAEEEQRDVGAAGHDPGAFVGHFKMAELREVESMRRLRVRNLQKRAEDAADAKYCVCRRALHGMMLRCELCKDWFHANCVSLPKSATLKNKASGEAVMTHMSRDLKFLCPQCLRSRRPRLESILAILVSLQKLPVRLVEGEALQCLTERAMGWQDRARHALATDELSQALAKLSVFSQRMVELAARDKTDKIIAGELLKVANRKSTEDVEGSEDIEGSVAARVEVASVKTETVDQVSEDTEEDSRTTTAAVEAAADQPQAFSTSEHAYSSASKPNHGQAPKKHSRKSPLVPRQLETPVLELSPMAKAQLEELMMEGDLLEVSLDETQHIWRILQACKPQRDDTFPDFEGPDGEGGRSSTTPAVDEKVEEDELDEDTKMAPFPSTTEVKLKKKRRRRKGAAAEVPAPPAPPMNRKLIRIRKRFKLDKDGNVVAIKVIKQDSVVPVAKFVRRSAPPLPKTKLSVAPTAASENGSEQAPEAARCKPVKRETSGSVASSGDDYGEERCAAAKCRRPTGEVNWVQCDGGCDLWFHLVCVGLSAGDVSETEDYICAACSNVVVGRRPRRRVPSPALPRIAVVGCPGRTPLEKDEVEHQGQAEVPGDKLGHSDKDMLLFDSGFSVSFTT